MTQAGVLEPVFRRLKTSPLTLEQLWSDYASQWHLLGWSIEQVSLYLKCLPNIQINSQADGEIAFELADTASASSINLADELVALLIKVGRRSEERRVGKECRAGGARAE